MSPWKRCSTAFPASTEETPDPNATITPKKGEAVLFQNGSEAKFLGITKGTTFGYITK